jgi:hypothetical protein
VTAFENKSLAINMKPVTIVLLVFATVISIKVVEDILFAPPTEAELLQESLEQDNQRVDNLLDWINEPD